MPLIFQARSNPAGVVISNSIHINGGSLGSSCAKASFSNLNLSSFLFSAPISLSDHLSYRCFELPARWCSLCFGSCLCLLAYRSTPWHPSPGASSTRGIQPLGWLPYVYKPAWVVTTHRGARAHSRPCLPRVSCEIPLLLASFPFPHLGNKVMLHEICPPRWLQMKGQGFSLHIFPDLWYYHVIIHKD